MHASSSDPEQKAKLKVSDGEPVRICIEQPASAENLSVPGLPERFQVLKLLGQGGMGTVYQVADQELKCDLAVKVMSREWLSDQTALQRFEVEAAAAGELCHPHIAQVYGYSAAGEMPYITMEYIEGASFDRVLKRERIIEQERLLNMVLQICDALEYAHLHGIVHRDLKPSNIILQDAGDIVKLVDFGIAKVGPKNDSATQLTQKGEVFGSPTYMSPEQAHAGMVDHRTDLYSLGCIVYEALSGKPLFIGDNAVQVMLHHINTSPKDYTRKLLKKGHSKSLIAVLEKLLQKQPAQRYQSAAEVADDIRRVLNNQMSFALLKKPFLLELSKRGAVAGLAAAGVVALIGLCSLTAIMVARLQSDHGPNERVYDKMVARQNEARDLIDKIVKANGQDVTLAAKALRSLVAEDAVQNPRFARIALGSAPKDLLSATDQATILKAYTSSSSAESKQALLPILAAMNDPTADVINVMCTLPRSQDKDMQALSKSALTRWSSLVDKRYQPELSTALSYSLLADKELLRDTDGPFVIGAGEEAQGLQNLTKFSDVAVANIRQSAAAVQPDSAGVYRGQWGNASHPLTHVAIVRKEYYPELVTLLRSRAYANGVIGAVQKLGAKASQAVPELCEMIKSSETVNRAEIATTLAGIGPVAAPQAVPALAASYAHHRREELTSLATALEKMGPTGIAVLQKEALRPLDKSERDNPNSSERAAVDAAKDALLDAKP